MIKHKIITTGILFLTTLLSQVLPVTAHTGSATYYSSYFVGRKMSNGKTYRPHKMTCAHMYLPLGSHLKITNINNHKSVIVIVTDRGNFGYRNIDLSVGAFKRIAKLSCGRIKVKIDRIK